jgi:hypothetical protein
MQDSRLIEYNQYFFCQCCFVIMFKAAIKKEQIKISIKPLLPPKKIFRSDLFKTPS